MVKSDLLEHDAVLAEIVQKIVRLLSPQAVYLFGSHARGDAGPNSDYDLMVVVPHSNEPSYRRAFHAHQILGPLPAPVDIIILTHNEFERKKEIIGTLPETVMHEGRELYAA